MDKNFQRQLEVGAGALGGSFFSMGKISNLYVAEKYPDRLPEELWLSGHFGDILMFGGAAMVIAALLSTTFLHKNED